MILCAVFDKEISKIIQPNIVDRIKRHVCATDVRLKSERNNPVEKVLLLVTGCEGNLLIDEIPEQNDGVGKGAGFFEHTAFLITQVPLQNYSLILFFFLT